MQQKDGSYFPILSASLCLFVVELEPLMLRIINKQFLDYCYIVVVVCPCPFICWLGIVYPCVFLRSD